ncbi:hypothetical protein U9M48_005444, partial [Paspalum notatum var. saurae]
AYRRKEEYVWRLQGAQPEAADPSSCKQTVDCSAYLSGILGKIDPFKKKKMVGMEGAALSGMLNILANKLAPLVIKQYSSIVGVTKDLQDLQVLVQVINCWLEKAGYEAVESDQLWLRQLKHVAYDVDDIVDEFHLEAEKHEANGGNHILSKSLITKARSFLLKCKAVRKIQAIKERFAAIVKQRTDFTAIVNSLPDGHPVPHINRTVRAIPTLPTVDETSVRGRDQEKHEIISKLADNNNQHIIKIVSVIGLGGCGKTTLAKLVFNDGNIVKEHFEVRVWVHVSQEFDVEKLVKKLFEAISGEKSECCSSQKMAETISNKLSGKRYLLVLDDVWTEDRIQWEEFMVHMKSGAPGSSILLTTRSRKVAEAVESTDLFNLLFLSDVDSWELFSQSFGVAMNGLDSDFLEVGREIVNKCGGVPLAIKVLAGVLRGKRQVEEWKAMRNSNLLEVEDKEHRVSACLRLSYFHLPSHLKQCFTMCSLYPKGQRMYKEQLIDQWIAHDMISLTLGVDSLEDIGDGNFNSLVQVSFLQDVDEEYGRVSCKMHDLVHDLARSILCEEISTDMPEDATSSTKYYRYLSLVEEQKKLLPKKVFHNARAIYVHGGADIIFGKELKNAKHLRSIIVNSFLPSVQLSSIVQIKNLKYLEISGLYFESLPEAISDIWSLQAVHLINSGLLELPKSIGKLQKLRTLNLSGCGELECLPDSIGDCNLLSSIDLYKCTSLTALPKSIGKLQKLRMLNLSYCEKLNCLPDSIGDCRMLSSIDCCGCEYLTALPNSVGKLQTLRTLNLSGCWMLKCLPDSIGDCRMLSSIDCCGCEYLTTLPNSVGKLQTLRTLNLSGCWGLKCLPDSIGDCNMLSSIACCSCKELTALPNSIGRNEMLRVLRLCDTKIEKLPSNITTLRNLECLDLSGCWNLVELPEGIGNLENLQVLNLENYAKLRGMPIGIGQLSQIEKLSLFVVGEGEKCAGISELANVGRDSESLIIRGIKHVLEQDDAHMACLKQKTNLQSLKLEWERYHKGEVDTEFEEAVLDGLEPHKGEVNTELEEAVLDGLEPPHKGEVNTELEEAVLDGLEPPHKGEVNTELEEAVLDCLEPPPGIEELQISGYSGRKYARWMQDQVGGEVKGLAYFQFLRVMKLSNFLKLKHLDGLVELPCLEELVLRRMPYLESISGGPFPLLATLKMEDLHSLGEVWIVAEGSMSDGEEGGSCSNRAHHLGQVQVGNFLTYLDMINCPKLKMKTFLPLSGHLTHWQLTGQLNFPIHLSRFNSSFGYSSLRRNGRDLVLNQYVPALESLDILFSDALTEVPKSLGSIASLQSLDLSNLSEIQKLPDCLGALSSLQELSIWNCNNLSSLPQSMCQLTSLQSLDVSACSAIHKLPDCLGELQSLQELTIKYCDSVSNLPQSMGYLTSLQKLQIEWCPALHQLPECLGELSSLQTLYVGYLPNIKRLPQSLQHLTSLQYLTVVSCHALHELPGGLGDLRSLCELHIDWLPSMTCFPESMWRLTSLKKLHVGPCYGLTSLPQGMEGLSSLEKLCIYGCERIKSLPEGIKHLTALKKFEIINCPDLATRCKRGGEDWHLISQIPRVLIDTHIEYSLRMLPDAMK